MRVNGVNGTRERLRAAPDVLTLRFGGDELPGTVVRQVVNVR
jgi:hypothetical protein